VAARIRELAKRKGIALTRVAAQAGVSKGHLWNALGGESSMTLDFIARLAIALEVDPAELVKPPRKPRAPKAG
jgi:transcriptional regulator with XRE-family HTH domain